MTGRIRVGRITASLLWIALGILIGMDQWSGGSQLLILLQWWPLILVCWGLEYIIFYLLSRRNRMRFRLDIKGILTAVIAAAAIFFVTEQNQYLYLWSKVSLDLTAASSEFSEASGNRIELKPVSIPVDKDTDELTVEGINGDLIVHRGDVEKIEVRPVVWIDEIKADEAQKIADATSIEISEGDEISLRTQTQTYGESNNRQPRINMEIILPEKSRLDINVQTTNGKVTMTNIEALRNIAVRSGNGSLIMRNLVGDIKAQTVNGNMDISSILGNVDADTKQGTYKANDISGAAKLYTQVGDVSLTGGLGDIDVNTRNGNVLVDEANFAVKAESLNGNIEIRSVSIGGDWSVYSAVGVIHLYLPPTGDYKVSGSNSYGTINTDLPLKVEKRTITGEFGTSDHSIQVDGNGDLNIMRNSDAMIKNNDDQTIDPSKAEETNPSTNSESSNKMPKSNTTNTDEAVTESTSTN